MFKFIKSIVASVNAFVGKVKKYPSHVRWAYIGVFVAICLFSFEIILSSLQLLLSREIGVDMMGEWLDILIVIAFGGSVVLFIFMVIILITLVFVWGKSHAEDTSQQDIKEMKMLLIKISRRLGVSRYGRKLK